MSRTLECHTSPIDRIKRSAGLLLGVFAPTALFAHTSDAPLAGFAAGAMHPWAGADHLIAMLLVGVWAAQHGGNARWASPLLFVGAMTAGSTLARLDPAFGAIDQLVVLSVIALGALIALKARLAPWMIGTIIGACALVHGYAHGLEIPAQAAPLAVTAGFAASTLTLHLGGLLIASVLTKHGRTALVRVAGASAAVAGLVLMLP